MKNLRFIRDNGKYILLGDNTMEQISDNSNLWKIAEKEKINNGKKLISEIVILLIGFLFGFGFLFMYKAQIKIDAIKEVCIQIGYDDYNPNGSDSGYCTITNNIKDLFPIK